MTNLILAYLGWCFLDFYYFLLSLWVIITYLGQLLLIWDISPPRGGPLELV